MGEEIVSLQVDLAKPSHVCWTFVGWPEGAWGSSESPPWVVRTDLVVTLLDGFEYRDARRRERRRQLSGRKHRAAGALVSGTEERKISAAPGYPEMDQVE